MTGWLKSSLSRSLRGTFLITISIIISLAGCSTLEEVSDPRENSPPGKEEAGEPLFSPPEVPPPSELSPLEKAEAPRRFWSLRWW